MKLLLVLLLACVVELPFSTEAAPNRKEHVVYMGERLESDFPHKALHLTLMKDIVGSEASKHLLYSYEKGFNGFVANLTDEEVKKLAGMERVVSVFPNKKRKITTTRSWDFMGFSLQLSRNNAINESDVIIGMIDTGIWPESPSFNDEGLGPPPSKFKGICQNSTTNFTCNRKIIGAQFFLMNGDFSDEDIKSPRDTNGHGTHTASIAAGSTVNSASFLGLGTGTARGGAPSARISVYKACWGAGFCYDADILAAFDAAIADGVDILSVSLGNIFAMPYVEDSVAIGSFHAMKKGILTSAAAGNSGPSRGSVENVAPWQLSVAASTIDRKFTGTVTLGNGATFKGLSLNTIDIHNKTFPLVYGGTAQNFSQPFSSRYCIEDTLNSTMVDGKIVLCDLWGNGAGPFKAGAVGAIMNENATLDVAYNSPIPTSLVDIEDGINIFSYIVTSTSTPFGTISLSTVENNTITPVVGSFSSRGPNSISPGILKPDLTAPGVDILAAWSPISSPSEVVGDNRIVNFNIISGTSMSCPHATAAAAYVKSFHPTWSPSAIKSALMTTAFQLNASLTPEAEFAYGSGHINPRKAIDPGLVYDAKEADYVKFLCAEGLDSKTVGIISGDNSTTCEKLLNGTSTFNLNYPSMALNISAFSTSFNGTFKRTVTNVGLPQSVYKASVKAPVGLNVTVVPRSLSFTYVGEKASFVVALNGVLANIEDKLSATLVWEDGVHLVKSPIVVYTDFYSLF